MQFTTDELKLLSEALYEWEDMSHKLNGKERDTILALAKRIETYLANTKEEVNG